MTIHTTSHVTDYAKRSDEMTEAPERIWAQKEVFSDDWDAGTFCTVSDGGVDYIRADHVDALLKAEREKALREAAIELECNWGHIATPEMRKAILALPTEGETDG